MKRLIFTCCLFFLTPSFIHAVSFGWAKEVDVAYAMCRDGNDNLYTTGSSPMVKYNPDGTEQMRIKNLGNGYFRGNAIALDSSGNIYICGNFDHTLTIGNTTVNSAGNQDVFVAAFDPTGKLNWIKTGSDTGFESCVAMALDHKGNVYVTGTFQQSVKWDDVKVTGSGGTNIFVTMYNPAGKVQWVQKAESNIYNAYISIRSIACGNNGNIYIAGSFTDGINFYSTKLKAVSQQPDGFIAAFNGPASVAWVKQAPKVEITAMKIDKSNEFCFAGNFSGETDLDNIHLKAIPGMFVSNVFIAKADSACKVLWAQSAGSDFIDYAEDLITDSRNNIYISGSFSDTAYFGNSHVASMGEQDMFVAMYDANGNKKWVRSSGGEGEDVGNSLCLSKDESKLLVLGSVQQGPAAFGATQLSGFDFSFVAALTDLNTGIALPSSEPFSLNIYPNPCAGDINISLNKPVEKNTLCQLHDISGKLVLEMEVKPGQKYCQIRNMAPGTYVLSLHDENGVIRQKLIVQ